ncbi:MAG: glutathione S-transferase family protein [Betaproteobacteria bacterium]
MKLHWSPKSPYVRKVMIFIEELKAQTDIELVRSVAAMTQPNQSLMIDNPLSKIPTLVLNSGKSLFDSVVICEFLNDLYEGDFFPTLGVEKWTALRWHAYGDGLLDALILWRNEREREVPLESLMKAFEIKVLATLKLLENETSEINTSKFTIGIVSIVCALGYLDYRFDALKWRSVAPHLSKWYQVIQERPSVKLTEPVEG